MQLANLDNEIFFKKIFTDPEVFRAFVRDVTGVDVPDAKIETEKQLERKVAAIRFKLDIYAESVEAPATIKDWLDLISESIKNPHSPKINLTNPGIKRAATLAEVSNIPESVLEDAKKAEAGKKTISIYEATAKENKEKELILRAYKKGRSAEEISDFLDISLRRVHEIIEEE
jgi:hypothetical protein